MRNPDFFILFFKRTKKNYIFGKTKPINQTMKQITIEEINAVLKGTIVGAITTKITAPEQLEAANETEISFIGNKKYEKFWQHQKLVSQL